MQEEKASGISPDDLTDREQILEEIQEVIASNAITPCASSDNGKLESEQTKALAITNRAVTSWGKETPDKEDTKPRCKRRSGSDPLKYLKVKRETDGTEERRNGTLKRAAKYGRKEIGGRAKETRTNARAVFVSTEALAATDANSGPVPSPPYGFVG